MNVTRFLATLKLIQNREQNFQVQDRLGSLRDALNALVQSPQNESSQSAVQTTFQAAKDAVLKFFNSLTAAEIERISLLHNAQLLFPNALSDLEVSILNGAMTPAVPAKKARQLFTERETLLSHVNQTVQSLQQLGCTTEDSAESPELGFLVPRSLFENELDHFTRELREIKKFLTFFSEAATGAQEKIQVGELSSTDPLIFLGVSLTTVVAVARSVRWMLESWKLGLEIRSLHANAKGVGLDEEVLAKIEAKINESVENKIDERVQQMLADRRAQPDQARINELANGLRWAHRALMARMERGMTLEFKLGLPPPPNEGDEAAPDQNGELREELKRLSTEIQYPQIEQDQLLRIPE